MVALNLWKNDRSNPRSLMNAMFKDFDRLFEDWPQLRYENRELGVEPACDVEENENEYLVMMDLPGIKKSDIDIEFSNGYMSVSGKRENLQEQKNSNFLRMERRVGAFRRTFQIPQGVTAEDIKASYEDGVLYVTLPKTEAEKGRKIEIGSGKLGILQKLTGKGDKHKEAANH